MKMAELNRKEITGLVIAFLLFVMSVVVQWVAGLAGDKDWLLLAAHMLLNGKKLYVDIIEVNPPLIVWIYTIPSFIAQKLKVIEDYNALAVFGLMMLAVVAWVSAKLIALHPQFSGNEKKQVAFVALLGFVFLFTTSPAYFFDREHIFLVFTFPYVLRFCPSLAQVKLPFALKVIIGSLAAIGFCIKPHCALVFAGVQLLYFFWQRSGRILISVENCALYLLGAVYVTLVATLTPEYFSTVLPMAMLTYSSYNRKINGFLFITIAAFSIATTFVDFRLKYRTPFRNDIFYFLGICALMLGYALVNNGWGYTYNPLLSMLLFLAGLVAWEFSYLKKEYAERGENVKQFQFGFRACMINFGVCGGLVLIGFMAVTSFKCNDYFECKLNEDMAAIVDKAHAHSFGSMGISFHPVARLYRDSGATFETRFNHLWMLPKMVTADDTFVRQHHWIIDYMANSLAEDMQNRKPDVMVVDASQMFYTTEKHIDLPDYFSAYPAFKLQWQNYRYFSSIDECSFVDPEKRAQHIQEPPRKMGCKYDIFRRTAD